MTIEQIAELLLANTGRNVRVVFSDGVIDSVLIVSVDAEGFVHSGPEGESREWFWTRLEDVVTVETGSPD